MTTASSNSATPPQNRRISRLAMLSLVFSLAMPLLFLVPASVLLVGTGGMIGGMIVLFFIPYGLTMVFFCAIGVAIATVSRARVKRRPELKGELLALAARSIAFTLAICFALSVAHCCVRPWYQLARESRYWREEGEKMRQTADELVQTGKEMKQNMAAGKADTNILLLVEESRAWRRSIDNLNQFDLWNWGKNSITLSFQSFRKDLHLLPISQPNGTNSTTQSVSSVP